MAASFYTQDVPPLSIRVSSRSFNIVQTIIGWITVRKRVADLSVGSIGIDGCATLPVNTTIGVLRHLYVSNGCYDGAGPWSGWGYEPESESACRRGFVNSARWLGSASSVRGLNFDDPAHALGSVSSACDLGFTRSRRLTWSFGSCHMKESFW